MTSPQAGNAAGKPVVSPRRPAPAPDRPRHLHAVPGRPAPGRRPPSATLVAVSAVTGLVLLVLVSINVLVGQSGFNEAGLSKEIAQKQQQVEILRVDVLRLSAPSRIHQRAQQLGMISAGELVYLAPSPGASASPSVAPKPAPARSTSSSPSRGRGGR